MVAKQKKCNYIKFIAGSPSLSIVSQIELKQLGTLCEAQWNTQF